MRLAVGDQDRVPFDSSRLNDPSRRRGNHQRHQQRDILRKSRCERQAYHHADLRSATGDTRLVEWWRIRWNAGARHGRRETGRTHSILSSHVNDRRIVMDVLSPVPRQNACDPKNQQLTSLIPDVICYNRAPCSSSFCSALRQSFGYFGGAAASS